MFWSPAGSRTTVHLLTNLLEQLVVQRVCAVELEHHVSGECVLDAANHVFRLGLCQLYRL